jgi:hypothetical protein
VAVEAHLGFAALEAGVGELGELTDPLRFVEHMALLADGPEIFRQQRVQRVGVGAQLRLVEGRPEPMEVWDHEQILPVRARGRAESEPLRSVIDA